MTVPPLAHLISADLLAFALAWYTAATLIRSRTTALDRLVISGGVLIGWTCALGLLASYWPWGLHPVALAEATAVPLIAALLLQGPRPARRPVPLRARLRRLVPVRDRALLLPVAGAVAFLLYPIARRGAAERLALVVHSEDLGRHAALYDTILRLGGLTSLHQSEAAATISPGLGTYPQGSHLTLATLSSFLNGGATQGSALSRLSLFVALFGLVSAGLATAVLWAVQRAAGPALRGWRGLALALPTAAYLVVAELPQLHSLGFLSEIFALGLLALLVGLAIRPLGRISEQAVALGALTVGVSFGHYLLLPAAGAVVLAWAATHRRDCLRHWPALLLTAAAAGPLALFPPYINTKNAGSADVLTIPGGIYPVGRHLLIPVVVAAFAALLTRGSLANRPRRIALLSLASVSALCFGVMQYQLTTVGTTSYFYEKMLHQLLVVGVICGAAALLPALGRRTLAGPGGTPSTGARLRKGLAVAAVTGCLAFTVVSNAQPDGAVEVGWQGSAGRALLRGADAAPGVSERILAIRNQQPQDGRVAVSLAGTRVWGDAWQDWASVEDNLWLSVLDRDQGAAARLWAWGITRHNAQDVVNLADTSPTPLRFYIDDTSPLLTDLRRLAADHRHPALAVSVLRYDDDGVTVHPLDLG
ncbi:hypothetical protein ACPC54_39640 [Kitasatospora sp. NPDC094028]